MIMHFEDYSVSDDGRIFSRYGKELTQRDNGHGYLCVQICGNKKKEKKYIHRLVATAFIPNPEEKPCVNHIDGNKRNNRASNLEWCTHEENTRHAALDLGVLNQYEKANRVRRKPVIGVSVYDPTHEKHFASIREAEKELGVSRSDIIAVLKGRQRTCGGMYWRYGI